MAVTVKNGVNSRSFETLVGRSVGDVTGDDIVMELLSLEGDENAQIRRNGNVFGAVESDVLQDGDELIFVRSGGSKGC